MDYLEGRLSKRERRKVEAHLAGCDACLEDAVVMRKLVQDTKLHSLNPVPEHVTKRAIETVKALKDDSFLERVSQYLNILVSRWSKALTELLPWRRPNLAPVRGSKTVIAEDLILLNKSFSDLDAEIEIEKIGQDRASILVKLSRDDLPEKPIRVTLFRNGREVTSYLFTGSAVLFEGIPFGRYALIFTRDGLEVGEYPFEIKETRHGRKQKK
jgi:hypothetical protein